MTIVGLIGCGRWGQHILRDLRALGCDVAVVARSPEAHRRAEDGGAVAVVETSAQLPDVDGVVVATPTVAHAEAVREVLPRQVPVFVEKPLTPDVADAEDLVARAGGRIFVMDKWRYHPGIEELGALARRGDLGRVLGVRTQRLGWGNPHDDVDACWILVPHDLSIGLEVLGHVPTPVAAVADVVDDRATGLTGLLHDGPGTPWLTVDVSTRYPEHRRTTVVLGDEAVAELPDGYATHVAVRRHDRPGSDGVPAATEIAVSDELPLLRELRAFVEHVEGGPPPRTGAAESLAVVRAVAQLRSLAGLRDT